jgi:hypothetical protein
MEKIAEKFEELQRRCDNVDKCILVLENPMVNEDISNLSKILENILDVRMNLDDIKDLSGIKRDYLACSNEIAHVQKKILFVMESLPDLENKPERKPLLEIACKYFGLRLFGLSVYFIHFCIFILSILGASPSFSSRTSVMKNLSAVSNTPNMSIIQYQNSPFIKKRNIQKDLQFVDFFAQLDEASFAKVP